MTKPVPRTCTEITQNEPDHRGEKKSRPLKEFRSKPAYVLLGDPGSGKTTAFEVESRELGEEAVLIDARRFIRSDLNSHPEWRDKMLFIDGLDESRAGQSDARTPLDSICNRLEKLGRPSFRISCREADWLGDNDRRNLATVSSNSQVTTLRLDPLTDPDIEHILDAHPRVDNAQSFVSEARERGIAGLLANPQTLNMLADVVGGNKGWPASRLETFDQACRKMAEERNEEHAYATYPSPPDQQTLDAAGHLCAVQLISGAAGFSLRHIESDADYPAYDACDYESPEVLRHPLSTRLFKGVSVGRFVPVHRHIAEFLGARHLARLISEGLPVRRVISLIAGEDGVVVTEIRGLSAWLAAHSRTARGDLIESDPIGVGLYGDIREFSPDEKRKLILSLNREVAMLPYKVRFAAALAPLASPDMESTLRDELTKSDRDVDHQLVVEFLLSVLRGGAPLSSLSEILFEIVHDDTWWPRVTEAALDAFIDNSADSLERTSKLKQLLADIRAGRVADSDNELLGTLLAHLYPREIQPSEVWDYLGEQGDTRLIGRHQIFWDRSLLKRSSDGQVAELLDHLQERLPGLRSALESRFLDHLPIKLLARGLQAHGDELESARLYNWLRAGAFRDWEGPRHAYESEESMKQVRTWLEQRPEVQKAVLMEGVIRCQDSDDFRLCSSSVWSSLHGSTLPPDLGLWSLERAVQLVETSPRLSEFFFQSAVRLHNEGIGNQGLTRSVLVERVRGHELLEKQLASLLDPAIHPAELQRRQEIEKYDEEDKRRRDQWIDYVRTNADALRENRAAPKLLHHLAEAYYGVLPTWSTSITGEQRIREQLGNDEDLTKAALSGLRATVWRDDVPGVDEIISLRSESRLHYLALPFLAGLDEIERTEPAELFRLNERLKRTALAFYYCRAVYGGNDAGWYLMWLHASTELVAEVLIKCAVSAIRNGEEIIPSLERLGNLKNDAQVARHVSKAILCAFPVRCALKQVRALDSMLWAALQHIDSASLQRLIEKKLSRRSMNAAQRVHWLAAGVLVAPAKYLKSLERFATGREARIRQLAVFLCSGDRRQSLLNDLPVPCLKLLVGLIGHSYGPAIPNGWVTLEVVASDRVRHFIQRLASLPGEDATQALEVLSSDAALHRWHDLIVDARDRQRLVRRDAAYNHPTVEQICRTLSNQAPANPSDLAALVLDRLEDLADQIRTGNTDDWRQYWNEDSYGKPQSSKHEDSCRDALLSDLRARLPEGVDAQPEGQYAGDKRADIRIAHKNFNVPVEIKKSTHPDLWSAARNQLIAKYTSDPATRGYGVYLVFWFGESDCQPPPSGARPSTAEELRRRLQATLTDDEARKISICVVDVSPAGKV